jgi:hypothetical protein
MSRIAPRDRYVEKLATSAACSRPYRSVTATISFSRMSRGKRVHVRQPGQVADDRADGRAPPPPRRQRAARRLPPAHLDGDVARELEHLVVQEEEPGEADLVDQLQLLVEPSAGAT